VLSVNAPGRGPLSMPIWYGYEPGGSVWFVTERDSRKGELLAEGARVSLCVQTEAAPYRYVSVEGPVTEITPGDVERDTRPLARRYLGTKRGDRYVESTGGEGSHDNTIRVSMRPERWLSVDYGKVGGAAVGGEDA
ncbi:MAG TPA: pyridoxamine 5'-phosphate oxidase family protein, partial [Thermoanaerobaculia bacterium]|nr:pyridoxamine 5'-phosphate oxidase family protein [Thermoanaerobaculia bacterium]